MSAGELRERLTFSVRTVISDGYGNSQGPFEDQFATEARIRPKLGGEEVMAARLQGKSLATVTVRCTQNTRRITADWRAVDARTGTIWNVRSPSINPDERRQWLEFLCEKGVPV